MKYLTIVIKFDKEPEDGIINVDDILLGGKVIEWGKSINHSKQLVFDGLKKDLEVTRKNEHNESGFLVRSNEYIARRACKFAMKFKPDGGKS